VGVICGVAGFGGFLAGCCGFLAGTTTMFDRILIFGFRLIFDKSLASCRIFANRALVAKILCS